MFFKAYAVSRPYIQMIKLNYLGWLIYFSVYTFYAIFWRQLYQDGSYSSISSLIWFAKEWAIWLILSPFVLKAFDWLNAKTHLPFGFFGVGSVSLFIAIFARVLLNEGEYPTDWLAVLIIMLPKYIPAFLVISLGWYIYGKQAPIVGIERQPDSREIELQVEHQGLTQMLKPSQIYFLKSAGNYVEIYCESGCYLKRGTLKELLDELPQATFEQVHRSYAVNTSKLEKLTNNENGAGVATLSNQQKIPVSKRYKNKVKSISVL